MAIIHRTTMSPGKRELQPCLWAPWRLPDGTPARGVLASARYRPISEVAKTETCTRAYAQSNGSLTAYS